jgi:hypothetical protein
MSVLKFHGILTLLSQPSALPIFDQISRTFFSRSFDLLLESEVLHSMMSDFRNISDCIDENGDIDIVNHRRQIIASTVGYPGRWNDKTVVRFDGFVTDITRGLYLQERELNIRVVGF